LTLSCPLEPTARLTVATSDGTATAGADYSPLVEQVTFPRGTVDATVSVPVLGDPLDEPAETLILDAQGGVSVPWLVLLDGRATGTIVDDDFCQKTIGYWKEHLEEWPISSLRVGAEQIDAAAMLLHLDYTGGDLTSRLAQQLVATKLSLAKGADPAIVPTVELADAFLVSYPVGTSLSGAPRAEADRLKTLLDKFNNGCKAHE
jgi:hypothetical protein